MEKTDHIDSIKQTAVNLINKITDWVKDKIGGWVLEKLEKKLKPIVININMNFQGKNKIESSSMDNYAYKSITHFIFITPFLATGIITLNGVEKKVYELKSYIIKSLTFAFGFWLFLSGTYLIICASALMIQIASGTMAIGTPVALAIAQGIVVGTLLINIGVHLMDKSL